MNKQLKKVKIFQQLLKIPGYIDGHFNYMYNCSVDSPLIIIYTLIYCILLLLKFIEMYFGKVTL